MYSPTDQNPGTFQTTVAGPGSRWKLLRTTTRTRAFFSIVPLGVLCCTLSAIALTPNPSSSDSPTTDASSTTPKVAFAGKANEPVIRPRLELNIPSAQQLLAEMKRSHAGVFVDRVKRMLTDGVGGSGDGLTTEELLGIVNQIRQWPDSGVEAVAFTPDREGRSRWAVRLDWSVESLQVRLKALITLDVAQDLFEGVALQKREAGRYELVLPDSTLAVLIPSGDGGSIVASMADLPFPSKLFDGQKDKGEAKGDPAPVVACRLNFVGTDKDSGATFFSSFHALTSVDYSAYVDPEANWRETIRVNWPPISGMGAKMFFGRIKHSFFVPKDAFGALALNTMMAPGMMETAAGFGPQFVMEPAGSMTMVGEAMTGPLSSATSAQMCVTLLPGTGFLPMPDIVAQTRTKNPDKLIESIREAAGTMNENFITREQPPPWREATVRNRTVFWSEGSSQGRGMVLPFSLRPVLFVTKETDIKGKRRDYLVVAWTSTKPQEMVRRWLGFSRSKQQHHLPTTRKTNGQVWINWEQVYRWAQPYIDLSLNAAGVTTMLPTPEEAAEYLTPALITSRLRYSGLQAGHEGPLPLGALIIPSMMAASMEIGGGGSSDLARERMASQRLKVLYHHCKLFHQDLGRWPAELQELDGYIDFAGHPDILTIPLSSKKAWSDFFGNMFKDSDDEKGDEDEWGDDEDDLPLRHDLYVIDWSPHHWTLGYAAGTFEHLQSLYIDEDGSIHRVAAVEKAKRTDDTHSSQADGPSVGHLQGGRESAIK